MFLRMKEGVMFSGSRHTGRILVLSLRPWRQLGVDTSTVYAYTKMYVDVYIYIYTCMCTRV
jgi:hypothetical protein